MTSPETSIGDNEVFPEGQCRLVLIGKTGCGKSATGNTILGKTAFKTQEGFNSVTKKGSMDSAFRFNIEIQVTDTPGLEDTDIEDSLMGEIITRSLCAIHPGPHAVLLAVRIDHRFTPEDYKVFLVLKSIFGDDLPRFMIVVFVGASLQSNEETDYEDMSCTMDGSSKKSDTSDAQVFEDGTCRLILIGKTGSGKSATANTIVGRNCFKEGTGINSETKIGGFNYVNKDNVTIEVMDTPGLADTDDDDEILVEEIKKSVFAMHPGPHALLLVLKGNARFTKEEFQVYQALKEIFGVQFASYLIVVFTSVNAKEEYAKIMEDQIRRCANLNTVLNEANWRYVLIDNKADENEKRGQVHELLGKVKSLVVTNQSSYFRHNFSDHLRAPFDEMVNDELKLLRKKMLINSSDASNDTTQEFCDSTDQSNATNNLGEFQETPDGGSVTLRSKESQETNESPKRRSVSELVQQFNQLKPTPLTKRSFCGPRTREMNSSDVNKNARESVKKKCENLSLANKPTEQASVEVDNGLHRQSKIYIKDKIVNQPEKMTETQRYEYKRSLNELPDKVKEGLEKENVKDKQQCAVM